MPSHNAVLVSPIPDQPATCLPLRGQRALTARNRSQNPSQGQKKSSQNQPKIIQNRQRRGSGSILPGACPGSRDTRTRPGRPQCCQRRLSAAGITPGGTRHSGRASEGRVWGSGVLGQGPAAEDGDGPYFGVGWHLMVGVGDGYVSGLRTRYNFRLHGSSKPVSRFLAVLFLSCILTHFTNHRLLSVVRTYKTLPRTSSDLSFPHLSSTDSLQ